MTSGGGRALRNGQTSRKPSPCSRDTISPDCPRIWDITIFGYRRFGRRRQNWPATLALKAFVITTTGSVESAFLNGHSKKWSRRGNPTFHFAFAGLIKLGRVCGTDRLTVFS